MGVNQETVCLWVRYEEYHDYDTLQQLLEYNKERCIKPKDPERDTARSKSLSYHWRLSFVTDYHFFDRAVKDK